eukprot:Plantae.Rhodophyta-Rhodochaete_pulchella.ctg7656.p1 GENE.Plantae.Rhodophyta-Rhodochaete_pulchella.ctg7656~~Plantae.Rhodophyta-Rhodochaete_pulchella.ctg7656.p1  ORF type:complete len:141 (+),score=18.10 Plantae.Rhodophyta-Rhodochaete_pulchella.ctg7656:35-457(+)
MKPGFLSVGSAARAPSKSAQKASSGSATAKPLKRKTVTFSIPEDKIQEQSAAQTHKPVRSARANDDPRLGPALKAELQESEEEQSQRPVSRFKREMAARRITRAVQESEESGGVQDNPPPMSMFKQEMLRRREAQGSRDG